MIHKKTVRIPSLNNHCCLVCFTAQPTLHICTASKLKHGHLGKSWWYYPLSTQLTFRGAIFCLFGFLTRQMLVKKTSTFPETNSSNLKNTGVGSDELPFGRWPHARWRTVCVLGSVHTFFLCKKTYSIIFRLYTLILIHLWNMCSYIYHHLTVMGHVFFSRFSTFGAPKLMEKYRFF